MTTYKIQMMTNADYNNYMTGGYNYTVKEINVNAENAKEAIAKAKAENAEYVINENTVITLDEAKAIEAEKAEAIEAMQKKEAEAKAKRKEAQAKKVEKDLANGITPEMRKAMTNAKRYAKKIAEMEKELAELKAKKDYWDKKAKKA